MSESAEQMADRFVQRRLERNEVRWREVYEIDGPDLLALCRLALAADAFLEADDTYWEHDACTLEGEDQTKLNGLDDMRAEALHAMEIERKACRAAGMLPKEVDDA